MKINNKPNQYFNFILIFLLSVSISFFLVRCNKNDDNSQIEIENNTNDVSNDKLMSPGPDPEFLNNNNEQTVYRLGNPLAVDINSTWERYMYVDKTDTIYNNTTSAKRLGGYLKQYGFTGVYFYSTSGILSSTSNFTNFSVFLKTLSDSGVIYRSISNGSSTTFQTTGNVSKYNTSQTDINKKINRANLELEWWNGASTWSSWNTKNQEVSNGTIPDNDFYEGWYKNLGSTVDTIAAKDQVRYSDRILLHCYQNGIPTYSYANARSTGATGGRLDIIAKGARQVGRKIDLFIIISAENTAWGAGNTFTGPALAAASNQTNPYLFIETQAYNNIYGNMTTFQKQWINFKGFVWFTKRYCYRAIPPR